MPPRKASNGSDSGDTDSTGSLGNATIADRIAAFAMLDSMGDATQAQKTLRLSLVGFSQAEIATMLQASPATVRQNLYTERRKQTPAKKAAKKPPTPD